MPITCPFQSPGPLSCRYPAPRLTACKTSSVVRKANESLRWAAGVSAVAWKWGSGGRRRGASQALLTAQELFGVGTIRVARRQTLENTSSLDPTWKLTPWYLNVRRIADLIGSPEIHAAVLNISHLSGGRVYAPSLAPLTNNMVLWLRKQRIMPFEQLLLQEEAKVGQLFTAFRDFYCRGLPAWRRYSGKSGGPRPERPQISARYDFNAEPLHLTIPFDPEHLVSESAWCELSGRRRLFVLGYITRSASGAIEARPFVIADILIGNFETCRMWNYNEVFIDTLEQFSEVRDQLRPDMRDLVRLKDIKEAEIKHSFAAIINEEVVPKDWGGEFSDLFSTEVKLDGRRISSAFAFKGPARFSEMTLAHLGKNGDQIERLFNEPADLLVLQHCHRIHRSVRSTMRAFATRVHDPRHFCLVDGYDTIRVLRAYRKCGF
jgi:hypothetical protein